MVGWVKHLLYCIDCFSFQERLLARDTFEVHMTEPVKKLLKEMKNDDALIPSGCTWNKPFKDHGVLW